jgi:phosphatidylglycerophosphate synthase
MSTEPVASNPVSRRALNLPVSKQLSLALLAGAIPLGLIAVFLTGFNFAPLALSLGGYLIAAALALKAFRSGFPHSFIGLGNLTTLFRMVLVAALLAPLLSPASPWLVAVIATTALILDGVDGWVARREGRVSAFGARLDMEVDAAIGLILALNVWAAGILGPIVLLLGLPRYVFILAAQFLPWLNAQLPESLTRKVICVVQVGGLIGLMVPILPILLTWSVFVVSTSALLWSFGKDTLWLWRHRGPSEK